jgi:hypothetical protein
MVEVVLDIQEVAIQTLFSTWEAKYGIFCIKCWMTSVGSFFLL